LVARHDVLISDHGYNELAADDILVTDILEGAREGVSAGSSGDGI